MSGLSTDPISEKDNRSHDDTERTEMASDTIATNTNTNAMTQAIGAEPPSERPAVAGPKYSIFTVNEKRALVFAAAAGAFFSPLSAQIYFPALDTLSRDLHVSVTEVNLTVTTYMIVQAIAPMFVGSLADSAGRRPAYILCFIIYIAACGVYKILSRLCYLGLLVYYTLAIGCALAPNYGALLALRAVQSAGSSSTVSLCQAVVSDVVTSAERGSYVAFTSVPIILAPSVGPVIGGLISQYLGWRWIFCAVATAIPAEFSRLYGFDGLKIGLVYVPLGVGSIVSVFVMGRLANWNYRRHCRKLNIPYDRSRQQDMAGFPIEQVRLQISLPFLAIFTAVLIGFGWAIEYKAHLAVEIVLLFLQGVTLVAFSNLLSTLIVDINPGAAGAATAANNLTRCLVGAGASAFINPLMTAVGAGWAFTIIAFSYVLFAPVLWLILRNGVKWREAKARRRELGKRQIEKNVETPGHETDKNGN
ncbi:hypothetical protein ONZ43_g3198 [Nemania bipapillata]|uniref:Uncharacterized protein n=1 Tax=Nemania bipapillata TaxID=110536 RepID=A0ACC2IXU1_9PEZI|nr:hypothetical protein ONZ43_g3198 [Nemania bipapillata]